MYDCKRERRCSLPCNIFSFRYKLDPKVSIRSHLGLVSHQMPWPYVEEERSCLWKMFVITIGLFPGRIRFGQLKGLYYLTSQDNDQEICIFAIVVWIVWDMRWTRRSWCCNVCQQVSYNHCVM